MVPFIETARELHAVASPEAYRAKHARAIADRAALGMRFVVHESPGAVPARISSGRWITDCECGAGNATDPVWGFACCFGCGAVHEQVVFPVDVASIEQALIGRRSPATRNWDPSETVEALIAETTAHLTARGATP